MKYVTSLPSLSEANVAGFVSPQQPGLHESYLYSGGLDNYCGPQRAFAEGEHSESKGLLARETSASGLRQPANSTSGNARYSGK